ncbi:MAG: sigma-54 dependent transcriptional regulator [bacterium]
MTKTILIVDDDIQMCVAMEEMLRRAEYQYDIATTGLQAQEKLFNNQYDLVITDLRMPHISGLDLLKKIRGESPETLVIMISAHGTIDLAVEAMKEGAFDFITKPFSSDIILATIERSFIYARSKKISPKAEVRIAKEPLLIGKSKLISEILALIDNVAPSKSTVLIHGESGTGKELIAKQLHLKSPRCNYPFIAVNCAALPEGLLESELFGHERGAFTGAVERKIGKFELANKGTILLDEVSEMNIQLQAKLLRALQEHEVDRVGGRQPVSIDVRVIATTNRDLKKAINEGKFREDLYYRLNVIPINLGPLRERLEDISTLVEHFIMKYNQENNKQIKGVSEEGMKALEQYNWPGNIRELENIIERAIVISKEDVLTPKHLFLHGSLCTIQKSEYANLSFDVGTSLPEMERQLILKTLEKVEGNRTHAAKILGISIRTLRNKLNEYKQSQGTIISNQ